MNPQAEKVRAIYWAFPINETKKKINVILKAPDLRLAKRTGDSSPYKRKLQSRNVDENTCNSFNDNENDTGPDEDISDAGRGIPNKVSPDSQRRSNIM